MAAGDEAATAAALERCELLVNKAGHALLAHGRSGCYTDSKRVLVPMIHGQALLPDLKITDSSEALLTGRAPPFRLAVRAVHRSGEPYEGVAFALSDPFVVSVVCWGGARGSEAGVGRWESALLQCRGGFPPPPRPTCTCKHLSPPPCLRLASRPPLPACLPARPPAGGHGAGQGRRQARDPAHRRPRVQD